MSRADDAQALVRAHGEVRDGASIIGWVSRDDGPGRWTACSPTLAFTEHRHLEPPTFGTLGSAVDWLRRQAARQQVEAMLESDGITIMSDGEVLHDAATLGWVSQTDASLQWRAHTPMRQRAPYDFETVRKAVDWLREHARNLTLPLAPD